MMPSLGFGFERLGLLALRAPIVSLLLVLAASVVCLFGLPRLQADDALSELFRAETPVFQDYKKMSDRFPASEFDVLVVVEGAKLLTPELFEQVRTLHLELEFAEGVAGVLSAFSMRDPPDESGYPPPMIPDELPQGPAFMELIQKVANHPLLEGKFLSIGGDAGDDLTILVVSLNQAALTHNGLAPSIASVEQTVADVLKDIPLKASLSGAPVMQLEIRSAIERDRIVYNFAGFLVGAGICLAFFRRISLVFIAAICPVVAVLWALGLLGLYGLKLNTFINVIPPLVMVIAFSDSMHMVFSIRRRVGEGDDRWAAARHAVRTVGPACVLTSITTSLALLSLAITDSALIRTFGFAGAFATLLAFISVIVVVPVLSVLIIRNEEAFRRGEVERARGLRWLRQACIDFAAWLSRNYMPVALLGIAALVAFAAMHLQLEPLYRLSDEVPRHNQSVGASKRLDARLTGAYPLHIMVEWPEEMTIGSAPVLDAIAAAHGIQVAHPDIGNVWSVETLRQWLKDIGIDDPKVLERYLGLLPDHLVGRFVNTKSRSALVTGRLPNLDADQSVPIMRDLQAKLAELKTTNPKISFTVTGLTAVSALQSASMIAQLNRGLLMAIAIVIVLIGIAFRSVLVMAMSLLPNLFPIVGAGSIIYLSGGGLAYASVIALTVGFGLAVDDTIHFLARLERERNKLGHWASAVMATLSHIGPVLILTTIVLVAGLAITMFSDLPSMRLFGKLTMIVLGGALVGDIVILPALIMAVNRLFLRNRRVHAE